MTERPFTGTSYVDIRFQITGVTLKRLVAVTYAYTPPWPYYDRQKRREVLVQTALDLSLQVLARRLPRGYLDDIPAADRQWVSLDPLMVPGLLEPKVRARLRDYIDQDARHRDQAARADAQGATPPCAEEI